MKDTSWRDHNGKSIPPCIKDGARVNVVYRNATSATFDDMNHEDLWKWEKTGKAYPWNQVSCGAKDIVKWRLV